MYFYKSIEDAKNICLIMEYINGLELFEVIRQLGNFLLKLFFIRIINDLLSIILHLLVNSLFRIFALS